MKRILFFHSQTLHARVSIPVAMELIKQGFLVYYLKNRPDFLSFSVKNIINNPFSVSFINRNSLRYVAKQINYTDEFDRAEGNILTTFSRNYGKYDAVVSTSKDLPKLRAIGHKYKIPAFALGYEHIPMLIRADRQFNGRSARQDDSIFFQKNLFTEFHKFEDIFNHDMGIILNNFTFLDKVFKCSGSIRDRNHDNSVIIFHPGGYRNVITEPGTSSDMSYEKQRDFIIKICLPLIKNGLKPVIKTHPLPARYHTFDDLKKIVSDIEKEYSLTASSIEITDEWFWNKVFNASFILTFGSSAIYELWAAGFKNIFVANFVGQSRSPRFSFFQDIYLNTYEDYMELLKNKKFNNPVTDKLTQTVSNAYTTLFRGDSANKALDMIKTELIRT